MRRGRWSCVGHHASLPLAFAILYQDYPLRARRPLSQARARAAGDRRASRSPRSRRSACNRRRSRSSCSVDPRQVGILVTLWVGDGAALSDAAPMHRLVRRHRRAPSARLRDRCARRSRAASQAHDDIPTLLDERVRAARAGAERGVRDVARVQPSSDDAALASSTRAPKRPRSRRRRERSACRRHWSPCRRASRRDYVDRDRRADGGRRLLSDDLATLEAIAVAGRPAHRRDPASRTSATSASCASRRSASWRPKRSCARCARRSTRTSCSTR